MTEYDYSPEAYQRYMDTRSRVARWVDNTEAHSHEFRSPFGMRSDIGEEEMEDMSREMHGSHYGGHSRRRGSPLEDFNDMSAGLSTVGFDTGAPIPHPPFQATVPQSYAPAPRAPGPLPAQASYGSLYPSYLPPHQGQSTTYPPSPLVSACATPPPPIVIHKVSRHHSRHHRDHHHHSSSHTSSDSRSKSKSRPRTYIIQPSPSSAPMQYTVAPSSYPGQYGVNPPQTAPVGYVTGGYSSAPVVTATGGVVSPTPTYGYNQASVPGYVIVSPKGRDVKVVYT
ncbi:hypothetical protein VKT23_018127 [Stygiomarasmius scandens]|uniref:Uncharacterized protein n=1 Tax=Marasmiellus scandens TaxID=2682957 RepID=A0ABR1IS46_9AGAR